MWIQKIKAKSGEDKYKYNERYVDAHTGKEKTVSVTLSKNTTQARKEALKLLTEKIEKTQLFKENNKITLEDLVEYYVQWQERSVKATTFARNQCACKQIMRILKPDVLISRLDARYINKYMAESGKSATTLNEFMKRLRALLRWGYKNDFIDDISFLDKLEKFKDRSKKEKLEHKFLEVEEVTMLLEGMTHDTWKLLTKFMILSGLRVGEAIALKNSDIDFESNMITVDKNYDIIHKFSTSTKTESSERKVFMQMDLIDCVKEIQSYMKFKQKALGYHSNQLFSCENNGYVQYAAFNKYLRENGIRYLGRNDVTTHVLRHTSASLFLEQGIPVDVISKRLGHRDSKITREIYLHITSKLEAKHNEMIAQVKII